jgi:hypothetical protein
MPKFAEAWQDFPRLRRDKLPESEWNNLLTIPRAQLVQLVDYLGLIDLSRELYPLVDGELLRKVFHAFSDGKREFLQRTMRKRPHVLASPFGIKKWDGDARKLRNFTHFRGLLWFSQAVSLEDESYWWYLTHKLDVGRAGILNKAKKKRNKEEVDKLAQPLKNLISRFQTKAEA